VISTTTEGYNLGRKYDFRADSIEDMWSWINGIRTAVAEAHKQQAALEAVRSPGLCWHAFWIALLRTAAGLEPWWVGLRCDLSLAGVTMAQGATSRTARRRDTGTRKRSNRFQFCLVASQNKLHTLCE
jgi:hypothetical protein